MPDAPKEYSPEYCNLMHMGVRNAVTDLKAIAKKLDNRVFLMMLAALGQAGSLIIALVVLFIKLG